MINGRQQEEGENHYGTLEVEGLNGQGVKQAVIDMRRAYPRGTVKGLLRTLTLDPAANELLLVDSYEFSRQPRSVEEAFITYGPVRVATGGKSVRIGTKADGLTIRAEDTPARFRAKRLPEESKEGRTGDVITRITFEPAGLRRSMSLSFRLS